MRQIKRFYKLHKELLKSHLSPSLLGLYAELKTMEQNDIVTTLAALSKIINLPGYTIRRMLITLENAGLVILKSTNQFTRIKLKSWDENKTWRELPHNITLTESWQQSAAHKGVLAYLLMSENNGVIKNNVGRTLSELRIKEDELVSILNDLTADKLIRYELNNNIVTVNILCYQSDNQDQDYPDKTNETHTEHNRDANIIRLENKCKTNAKRVQNDSKTTAKRQSNECKTHIYDYAREDKNKNKNRKEEEDFSGKNSSSYSVFLAKKLSETFTKKNIAWRDDISSIVRHIEQLIKSGAPPGQIKECIDWYSSNYADRIYSGYTFQKYFYVLLEIVEHKKSEAVIFEKAKLTEHEKIYKEEHKIKEDRKFIKEALQADKFYLVRKMSLSPRIVISQLNGMLENGRATKNEVEKIIHELNLNEVAKVGVV